MRKSIIKAKLARNEPVLVTCLHLTDGSLYELVSLMGFDGIWMDLEHHAYGLNVSQELMRASRVGNSDILARPAKGEFMRMGRLLESGATGILYPRCEDAAEAREVVRWAKFYPQGERGFDGANGDAPYCTMPMDKYVEQANAQTFVAIQIEDSRALENVEEIAAVGGVDVLFFGPGDFSVLNGIPGQFDNQRIVAAMERIAAAAANAGKHWGTPVFSLEHGRELLDMGARFLTSGADILMVKNGLESLQNDFSKLGLTFANQLRSQ